MTKKILVLDDDEAVVEVLEAALEYANFAVKKTKEADIFEEIKEFNPDLVLIDYILQGINGGEICHQIKCNDLTRNVPVILISAYPKVLLSLGDYGSDAFIAKPFDLDDLILQINSCMCNGTVPDQVFPR